MEIDSIQHSGLQLFTDPVPSPSKRYNLKTRSGMCICAENACVPQTGGNEVAIWYRMCNHNKQNFMNTIFFLPPLAMSGEIFGLEVSVMCFVSHPSVTVTKYWRERGKERVVDFILAHSLEVSGHGCLASLLWA